MNKQLLKRAWLTKWIKETKNIPKPKVNIEKPICDKVLKATIFFKSTSNKAERLEKNIVNKPKKNKLKEKKT